mgnify:FL=1
MPLAYLWARTIRCEGPGCGAEVPLVGLLWLSRKERRQVALRYRGDKARKEVLFEIFEPKAESEVQPPIVKRFAATCPVCGYTTPYARVREQLRARKGGTRDARMIAVITLRPNGDRGFRLATDEDVGIAQRAAEALARREAGHPGPSPSCRMSLLQRPGGLEPAAHSRCESGAWKPGATSLSRAKLWPSPPLPGWYGRPTSGY